MVVAIHKGTLALQFTARKGTKFGLEISQISFVYSLIVNAKFRYMSFLRALFYALLSFTGIDCRLG